MANLRHDFRTTPFRVYIEVAAKIALHGYASLLLWAVGSTPEGFKLVQVQSLSIYIQNMQKALCSLLVTHPVTLSF